MVPWAGKGVGVRMKLWSRAGVVAGVLAWLLTAGAAGAGAASLSVQVLSNRADLVSGREALVAVALNKVKPASVKVTLNGSNVTSQFALRVNGSYAGLVTGLQLGKNVLKAEAPGARSEATIVDHPIGGPVFSGPQVKPWVCKNPDACGTRLAPAARVARS